MALWIGIGIGVVIGVLGTIGLAYFWPSRGVYDPQGFDPKQHWTYPPKP